MEQPMTVQLSKLTLGLKGKIIKIGREIEDRRRMVEMGIIPGALVEVERIAPMGDPIDVKVKGYHISLRKSDASKIMVEKL
jgi:Fe2+ transport system protein FeoA